MSAAPAKVFKKNEVIFKEGDKITCLTLIQSGAANLVLTRQKKNIDLFNVSAGQMLGEVALSGVTTYPYTAIASQETKVLEIPVETMKQVVEATPQMLKMTIKSLSDRVKVTTNEVKSARLEKDPNPCPDDQIARVFGSIYHSARHKGITDEKTPGKVTLDYNQLRQYSQRVFGDSIKRVEQATNILVKLKLAEYEMGKPPDDPEAPEQIMKVHFFDLQAIEGFFEFFQYYYFKGGRSELLKADDLSTMYLNQFIKMAENVPTDKFNVVTLDFHAVNERFKADLGTELKPDHFTRLEQKGIFAKRQARQDGTVVLQFDIKEYQATHKVWRILREVDKWNDKGYVDINEEEVKPKKKPDGPVCPQCESEIQASAKFCSECGYKIAA